MTTPTNKTLFITLAAAFLLGTSPMIATTHALAYDDDVDFVCGENDQGEDWCVSVDDLKAECPLSDPEFTSEECQGLLHNDPANHGLDRVAQASNAPVIQLIIKKKRTALHFKAMANSSSREESSRGFNPDIDDNRSDSHGPNGPAGTPSNTPNTPPAN